MDLATALATKAKELTRGMRDRVKRDPDVADYRAAFLPILAEFLSPDAKTPDPRKGASVICEVKDCGKRAIFIRFGSPLCFQHMERHSGTTEKADQQFNR